MWKMRKIKIITYAFTKIKALTMAEYDFRHLEDANSVITHYAFHTVTTNGFTRLLKKKLNSGSDSSFGSRCNNAIHMDMGLFKCI
jgi:hypothetical protein